MWRSTHVAAPPFEISARVVVSRNVLPGGELEDPGETTGRGKDAPARQANRSIKEVLGYPLIKDFRQRLSQLVA